VAVQDSSDDGASPNAAPASASQAETESATPNGARLCMPWLCSRTPRPRLLTVCTANLQTSKKVMPKAAGKRRKRKRTWPSSRHPAVPQFPKTRTRTKRPPTLSRLHHRICEAALARHRRFTTTEAVCICRVPCRKVDCKLSWLLQVAVRDTSTSLCLADQACLGTRGFLFRCVTARASRGALVLALFLPLRRS